MTKRVWPKVVFEVLPLVAGAVLLAVAGASGLSGELSGLTEAAGGSCGVPGLRGLAGFQRSQGLERPAA